MDEVWFSSKLAASRYAPESVELAYAPFWNGNLSDVSARSHLPCGPWLKGSTLLPALSALVLVSV